jgi:hypothetical protein
VPKSSNRKNETRRTNRDRRQRLEEMRKQQRAAERRKNFIFAGSGILVAIGLIAAAVIPAYLHDRAQKEKGKVGHQFAPTAAEKAAGCLGVHNDPVSPAANHVPGKTIAYATAQYGDTNGGTPPLPPSGGPHNPVPLSDTNRFVALDQNPRPERAVHNLEHGYIVGWYDAKLPAADVAKLKKLAADPTVSELLIVGWTAGDLPAGKHFVLTAWGRTDRCGSVSDAAVKEFYRGNVNKLAPEPGSGPGPANCAPNVLPSAPPCVVAPTSGSPSPSSSASASPSGKSTPSTKPSSKKTGKKH